jgi:hypothetical protein
VYPPHGLQKWVQNSKQKSASDSVWDVSSQTLSVAELGKPAPLAPKKPKDLAWVRGKSLIFSPALSYGAGAERVKSPQNPQVRMMGRWKGRAPQRRRPGHARPPTRPTMTRGPAGGRGRLQNGPRVQALEKALRQIASLMSEQSAQGLPIAAPHAARAPPAPVHHATRPRCEGGRGQNRPAGGGRP